MSYTNYIETTWVTEQPSTTQRGEGNVCFLASGTAPGDDNPKLISQDEYLSQVNSDGDETVALGSYFGQSNGNFSNNTWVYWMGEGSDLTGQLQRTDSTYKNWKLENGPFGSTGIVQIDPTGAGNWQTIAPSGAACPSGVDWVTGSNSDTYNGTIIFGNDGPYLTGTDDLLYTGSEARDIIEASGGEIRAMATQNGWGLAQQELATKDIQLIVPVHDVTDLTGITSNNAYEDLQGAQDMVAGNRRQVIWALPTGAAPNETYTGTGKSYDKFIDYISSDQNVSVIYANVSDSDGTPNGDPAAALAGMYAKTAPHDSFTLQPIVLSLDNAENSQDALAWKKGQIICPIDLEDEIGLVGKRLNYGFTFSPSTPSNRINNVRCKYIADYEIHQDLIALLARPDQPRISKSGLRTVISTVNGSLNRLESRGIIDPPDKRQVSIPLLSGTAEEWTTANETRTIPAMYIRWDWKNAIELIKITEFGDVL